MPAAPRLALRPRSAREAEPDLTRIVVTHRAIGRDLSRLAECGSEKARLTGPQAQYAAAVLAQVRAHNAGEDDILWPVVAAAAGPAVDLAPLADDRHAVTAALDRACAMLTRARPGAAPDLHAAVRELRDLLAEHIADEEQQLLPVMRRYLRADACQWCERQMQREVPLPVRRFGAPWLARHAQPDERRSLRAIQSWPTRLLLLGSGARFARLERFAFGTSAAGAAPITSSIRKEEKR
jgi:hemerythrin HHE cation binding domain-containing protein